MGTFFQCPDNFFVYINLKMTTVKTHINFYRSHVFQIVGGIINIPKLPCFLIRRKLLRKLILLLICNTSFLNGSYPGLILAEPPQICE